MHLDRLANGLSGFEIGYSNVRNNQVLVYFGIEMWMREKNVPTITYHVSESGNQKKVDTYALCFYFYLLTWEIWYQLVLLKITFFPTYPHLNTTVGT